MKAGKLGGAGVAFLGLLLAGPCLVIPAFGSFLPSTNRPPLDSWGFSNTNWLSHSGHAPVSFTNLVNVPYLGDDNALLLDSPDPAWLQYNVTESGTNRLTVDKGSIMLWFASSWSGTNQGGAGPGQWGRLIEVGSYTEDASYGWWSIFTDPAGVNLYFAAQTNDGSQATYLSAPIAFTTNRWHQIALTYSQTGSTLYLDGEFVTNGLPVTYWPGPDVLSNGFFIGSDSASGLVQGRGMFDDLASYDFVLDADTIANNFATHQVTYYANPLNSGNQATSAPSQPTLTPTFNAITGSGYLTPIGTNTDCITSTNIWITNLVVTAMSGGSNGTASVQFSIGGGLDGVLYDIFANSVLSPASSTNAWAWMGQGLHCVTYSLTNLPNTSAFLILGQPTDEDNDGLTTTYENLVSKTDPLNPDTDGDGLLDGEEVGLYFTNPKNQDSDGDGVIDQPFKVIITHPANNLPVP